MNVSRGWSKRDWAWLAVAVVGYSAAILFLLLWASRTNQDWAMGTVPDWLTVFIGVGGLGAVVVAVRQLRAQQRDSAQRELRERRAQASRVYWRVKEELGERGGTKRVTAHWHHIVNNSDEPIRNVGYVAVRADNHDELVHVLDRPLGPGEETYAAMYDFTDLGPGFVKGVRASIPHHSVVTTTVTLWDVAIVFSDSADRSWIRMPNLIVQEIECSTKTDTVIDMVKQWRLDNTRKQETRAKAKATST